MNKHNISRFHSVGAVVDVQISTKVVSSSMSFHKVSIEREGW